jgi:hypothetical protein
MNDFGMTICGEIVCEMYTVFVLLLLQRDRLSRNRHLPKRMVPGKDIQPEDSSIMFINHKSLVLVKGCSGLS